MMYLELNGESILFASEQIRNGNLVVFPTETVYGLGCDAFNTTALARVFEVKKRPRFDPLIIHIAALETLERIVDFSRLTQDAKYRLSVLSRALWPGPLTLILPKLQTVPDLATGGLDTAAVRFPDHAGALRLIKESTGAIAAPSANPFGYLSPTRAEHVRDQLGDAVDVILDGGPTNIGIESTVLDISSSPPRILRHGGLSSETLETFTGPLAVESGGAISSPGQLKSHYAPRKDLYLHTSAEMSRLPITADANAEAFLFFCKSSLDAFTENNATFITPAVKEHIFVLSESANLREAASCLFNILHSIDVLPVSRIHTERVPNTGLGAAINDRLFRAAAKTNSSGF
jgi:L-threonylcarbamoyladenylate synthase